MNCTNRHNLVGTRGLLVALYILATAHVVEAGIFAVGFLLAEWAGLGGFVQDDVDTVMEVFYFSLVNYTSLGLGDIYPIGHLRFLAGIESLHGFLLISCSASMLFLVTTRQNQ
nr:ion channel [Pseudohalocynthiibacter aestuariivivens]